LTVKGRTLVFNMLSLKWCLGKRYFFPACIEPWGDFCLWLHQWRCKPDL